MLVAAPSCRTDDWVTLVAISIAEHSETVALIVAALLEDMAAATSAARLTRRFAPKSRTRDGGAHPMTNR